MKKTLIILGLAAASKLFAADTNTTSNGLELAPVSLLEQAGLVREIAEDASRGFDAEAHAKWIREQIEALKNPVTQESSTCATPADRGGTTERTPPPFGSGEGEPSLRPLNNGLAPLASTKVVGGQPFFSGTNASLSAVTQMGSAKRAPSEELQQVIERLRVLKQGLETNPKSD